MVEKYKHGVETREYWRNIQRNYRAKKRAQAKRQLENT
jgi:t-SNARE complex subunit (syntaxin)